MGRFGGTSGAHGAVERLRGTCLLYRQPGGVPQALRVPWFTR
jgi:hypothetical protein